jgi:uncharacterized glyoxalase superfamily protein PhnB
MFTIAIPTFVVDSVLSATRFYTEKLGFDVQEIVLAPQSDRRFSYVMLKKGKCKVIFREPHESEQIEYSQVKHCVGRGAGFFVLLKKNIDEFFEKCQKKDVSIVDKLGYHTDKYRTFSVKDPFGIRVTFALEIEGYVEPKEEFLGIRVDWSKPKEDLQEHLSKHLGALGIRRRASKKYAKLWVKKTQAQ